MARPAMIQDIAISNKWVSCLKPQIMSCSFDMKKILIADDDQDLTETVSLFLQSHQYETLIAHEGIDVFEAARDQKPDLILLDWNMPFGKGSAVLEMLGEKDVLKAIPVIVLSGSDEPEMKQTALKLGARAVIRKPYDNIVLLDAIQKHLQ